MDLLRMILRFIIELIFNAFSLLVLLRFLLQCVKANFYHPVIQILVQVTNPILIPVRRITPIFGMIDWSCIVLVTVLGIIKYSLIMLLYRESLSPLVVLGFTFLDIIRQFIYIYLFTFILSAIASWLGSSPKQAMILSLLHKITNPILKRFTWNLRYKMIDFRPMVICFILIMGISLLDYIRSFIA